MHCWTGDVCELGKPFHVSGMEVTGAEERAVSESKMLASGKSTWTPKLLPDEMCLECRIRRTIGIVANPTPGVRDSIDRINRLRQQCENMPALVAMVCAGLAIFGGHRSSRQPHDLR